MRYGRAIKERIFLILPGRRESRGGILRGQPRAERVKDETNERESREIGIRAVYRQRERVCFLRENRSQLISRTTQTGGEGARVRDGGFDL